MSRAMVASSSSSSWPGSVTVLMIPSNSCLNGSTSAGDGEPGTGESGVPSALRTDALVEKGADDGSRTVLAGCRGSLPFSLLS